MSKTPRGGPPRGAIVSAGHNLDGDGTCNLTAAGDISAVDPLLGPLADNGGPTETHELLPGSPAIDAIAVADCVDLDGEPVVTDQRGVARPQGVACDIGAFERRARTIITGAPPGDVIDSRLGLQ